MDNVNLNSLAAHFSDLNTLYSLEIKRMLSHLSASSTPYYFSGRAPVLLSSIQHCWKSSLTS